MKQKELKQIEKDLKAKMKLLKKTEASLEKLGKNGELAQMVEQLQEENSKLKQELESKEGMNASNEEVEAALKERDEYKAQGIFTLLFLTPHLYSRRADSETCTVRQRQE